MSSQPPSFVSIAVNLCRALSEQVASSTLRNGTAEQLLAAGRTSTTGAEVCTNLDDELLAACEGNHDELLLLRSTAAYYFRGKLPTNPTDRAHTLALIRALASIEAVSLQVQHMHSQAMSPVVPEQQHLLDLAAATDAAECRTCHVNAHDENCDKLLDLMSTATRYLEAIPPKPPTYGTCVLASAQASVAASQLKAKHTAVKLAMTLLLNGPQLLLVKRPPGPAAAHLGTSAPRQLTTSRPSTVLKPAVTAPEHQPPQSRQPTTRTTMQRVQTSTTYTPLRIEPCAPAATAEAPSVPAGPRAAHRHLAAALHMYSDLSPINSVQSVHQPETRYTGKHHSSGEPHLADLHHEGLQLSAGFSTTSQTGSQKGSATSISAVPLGKTRIDPPIYPHPRWTSPRSSQVSSSRMSTIGPSQSSRQRVILVRHLVQQYPSQQPASQSARTRPAPGTPSATHHAGGSRQQETGPAVSIQTQEVDVFEPGCQLLPGWRPDDDDGIEHMVAQRPRSEHAAAAYTARSAAFATLGARMANLSSEYSTQVNAVRSALLSTISARIANFEVHYSTDIDPARSALLADLRVEMADLMGRGPTSQSSKLGFCGLHHDQEWLSHIVKAACRGHTGQPAAGSNVTTNTPAPQNS